MVDVGLQVDDAVAQRLLPLGHAALQALGLGLELGEVVDDPLGLLGVVEGLALAELAFMEATATTSLAAARTLSFSALAAILFCR